MNMIRERNRPTPFNIAAIQALSFRASASGADGQARTARLTNVQVENLVKSSCLNIDCPALRGAETETIYKPEIAKC